MQPLLLAGKERIPRAAWISNSTIQAMALLFILALTFLPNLGAADPSLMEARNFISAREMVESGQWLVPTLNGEVRLAKPPLPTWITALAGLAAGDIHNLTALRLPAAGMAMGMVYALFFLCRQLTRDKVIPFLAALMLAGCATMANAGREGTWDIYCHSFMLTAIWLLLKGYRSRGPAYGLFALCGLLWGCSFLSKGPVAFYALLLPFLISYRLGFGDGEMKAKWKGILLASLIAVLISVSWPLYIYLLEPQALAHNVSEETQAWFNRHKKPVWFYWGFVGQTGAWTIFAGAALVVPYARKRIESLGNYKFLFLWVFISFALLSVIPEKKERYLLPLLIPMALLTAYYVRYLIQSILLEHRDKWNHRIMVVSISLFLLACCAIPVVAYVFAFQAGHISVFAQAGITAGSLLFGYLILRAALQRQAGLLILSVVVLNALVLSLGLPLYQDVLHPDNGYQRLASVRNKMAFRNLAFYAVEGMSPQQIWETGKQVDTLRLVNQRLQLPMNLPAAVFSLTPLVRANLPGQAYRIEKLGTYQVSRKNPDARYFVYVLSRVPAD